MQQTSTPAIPHAHVTAHVVSHFHGVSGTAKALGVTRGAVRQWGEVVPPAMAMRAYCVSEGALLLDPFVYADWPVRGKKRAADE